MKIKNKKIIYLDNASATEIDKEVLKTISKSLKEDFYNPSSISEGGISVNEKIKNSRNKIAQMFSSLADEIFFTSGATESNNLAILGTLNNFQNIFTKPHIISTKVEHASVLEVLLTLEKENKIELSLLEVDEKGSLDIRELKKNLKDNTILVSIMYANNEIGTIFDIKEIAKTIRHFRKNKKQNNNFPYLHTDATQATNYLNMNVISLGIDLLSLNAGKIYGPKGIGILYKKRNIEIGAVFKGGDQEEGLRPGTLNAPLILGFEKALEITNKIKEKEVIRLTKLRNQFYLKLKKVFQKHDIEIRLNGSLEERLPNNLNISISKIPSDLFLVELSMRGIYLSEKSACKTGEKKSSHVLNALYKEQNSQNESLRFSLGRATKKEDLDFVIKSIDEILKKLKSWYL